MDFSAMQITEHKKLNTFCRFIDALNERTGKIVAWLFIPFTLLVVADVFTRYVLRNPWFYIDVNIQIMGTLIMLGGGYCLLHQSHIGVDTIVSQLSLRNRAIIDLILFPIFVGCIGALLWKTGIAAVDAWIWKERYSFSALLPPIYPYKTVIVLGVFLVLLQGTVKFIRDLLFVINPGMESK
jgi:TRAP-type mannitol/chloroaromatic compound transport system permease small subunit